MDPQFYTNLFSIPEVDLHNAIQGGLIISLASSIYYFLFGGILGMSGFAGSIVKFPGRHTTHAKMLVLTGVIMSSAIFSTLHDAGKVQSLPFDPEQKSPVSHLVLAGLLVGLGTELSNGCTSGHGLCGMPRFSIRSYVAVMVFLSTAIYTATYSLADHIPNVPQLELQALEGLEIKPIIYLMASGFLVVLLFLLEKSYQFIAKFALVVIGMVFGCGLMIAGMSYRSKIYNFLTLNSSWDPSLLVVLMTGVTLNIITFNIIRKFIHKPSYGERIEDPHGSPSIKLIIGAILFGLGWGIGGLCPGPYLLTIPHCLKIAFYWGVPFFLGQKISHIVTGDFHKQHHHQAQEKAMKLN